MSEPGEPGSLPAPPRAATLALALLVPEPARRLLSDLYFASVIEGITSVIDRSEYVLLTQLTNAEDPLDQIITYLTGSHFDGAIVVSHHSSDSQLSVLAASMPVVFLGRPFRHLSSNGYFVDVDQVIGGQQATDLLIARGCRRIGTIAGPWDMPAGIDRATGWRRSLEREGLPADLVAYGDFTPGSGETAMRELLERDPLLDGVFAANDLMARGAIAAVQASGRTVPADVAIVGFDDSPAATSSSPPLSTVSQPSTLAGATVAEMLLGVLRGQDVDRQSILPTHLVVRESA